MNEKDSYAVRAVRRLSNKGTYVPVDLGRCGVSCLWSAEIYDRLNPGQPVAQFRDVSTEGLIACLHDRYSGEGGPNKEFETVYAEPFGSEGERIFQRNKRGGERGRKPSLADKFNITASLSKESLMGMDT